MTKELLPAFAEQPNSLMEPIFTSSKKHDHIMELFWNTLARAQHPELHRYFEIRILIWEV
jgi:hypothetical protein